MNNTSHSDTLVADNSEKIVKMFFEFPESERKKLKRAAFESEMSMKDYIIAAVNEKITKDRLYYGRN